MYIYLLIYIDIIDIESGKCALCSSSSLHGFTSFGVFWPIFFVQNVPRTYPPKQFIH